MTKKLRMTKKNEPETPEESSYGSDEPDEQAIVDALDAEEEKKAKIREAARDMASDVAEKVEAKPKAKKSPKKDERPKDEGEVEDVSIDPDASYPMILNMMVTVGADDPRDMETFTKDVKEALDGVNVKHATVLLSKYQVGGKHILSHHYDRAVAKDGDTEPSTE